MRARSTRFSALAILLVIIQAMFATPAAADPGRGLDALAQSVSADGTLFDRLTAHQQAELLAYVRAGTVHVTTTGFGPADGSVVAAQAGASTSSGWLCGDRTVTMWKQDGNGNTRWSVWQRIWWYCDGTVVTAHGPSWGGSANYGWYYQGVVAQSETGGDGFWYYRLWTKHKTCWSCGTWFEDVDYPAIEMVVYGDGGITWSTTCDMC